MRNRQCVSAWFVVCAPVLTCFCVVAICGSCRLISTETGHSSSFVARCETNILRLVVNDGPRVDFSPADAVPNSVEHVLKPGDKLLLAFHLWNPTTNDVLVVTGPSPIVNVDSLWCGSFGQSNIPMRLLSNPPRSFGRGGEHLIRLCGHGSTIMSPTSIYSFSHEIILPETEADEVCVHVSLRIGILDKADKEVEWFHLGRSLSIGMDRPTRGRPLAPK